MKINSKLVVLGMILLPVFSTVFAQQWQYLVKPGDTLWSIADEYLISEVYVDRLQQFNSINDPLKLQPGTTISAPVEWLGNLPGSATIVSVAGNVEALREGESQKVSVGFELQADDKIITGDNGVAVLEFSDQSTVSVYSNTELSFNKFKQSFDGSIVKAKISIKSGRIKVNSNPDKKRGHRLEIESPAAVTAVRGTEFRVGVEAGDGDTVTEVLSGNVAVSAQDNDVALQKLYGTKTETGKIPIKPVKLITAPELIVEELLESKVGSVSWEKIERAQAYRIRVASDENLTDIVYDQLVISTQVNDIFFPHDGNFYTSIRAVDSNGIEGLDAVAKFSVNARPEPPLILGPENESSSFDVSPVFSWAIPANTTTQLQYQLSNNEQFEPLLIDQTIDSVDSFKPSSALLPGDYYWRVANIDAQGLGPFSNPASLSIVDQPTLATELQESGSLVSLRLSQDPSVSRYRVQVSRDAEFSDILYEQWVDGEQFSFDTKGAGKYYIRLGIEVSADNDDIQYGDAQKIIVPFGDWKQLMISIATGLLIIL